MSSASSVGDCDSPSRSPSPLDPNSQQLPVGDKYDADVAIAYSISAATQVQRGLESIGIGTQYVEDFRRIQEIGTHERVVIAVCGATGSGKSSLINAVLDDEIVPTSGAAACTSVVTRIQYSRKGEYRAEVHFLTREQWQEELAALISDVADFGFEAASKSKRPGDPAKLAWDKFHAVYPTIPAKSVPKQDMETLLEEHSDVAQVLGRKVRIVATTAKKLHKDLRGYLQSHKDKSAYWPLILSVDIFCPSDALETGAVLVDLPGVADLNAARNKVAQDFMEQCHHFWIVAPVQRAVDDKTALEKLICVKDLLSKALQTQIRLDGKLNAQSITYIATKCDGIRVKEVISGLNLSKHPKYRNISDRMTHHNNTRLAQEKAVTKSNAAIQVLEDGLKAKRQRLAQLQAPSTVTEGAIQGDCESGGGRSPSSTSKRKRATSTVSEGSKATVPKKKKRATQDGRARALDIPGVAGTSRHLVQDQDVSIQIAELIKTISREDAAVMELYRKHRGISDAYRDATSAYHQCRKELLTFCNSQRSAFVKEHLKASFRATVEEHADTDLGTDLPVFTVSSREYMRQKGHTEGEDCEFTSVEDTGIPELREYCHIVTLPVREEEARQTLPELRAKAVALLSCIEGAPEIAEKERQALQKKWESLYYPNHVFLGRGWRAHEYNDGLELLSVKGFDWSKTGVVAQLLQTFRILTDGCVSSLRARFSEYLEERCLEGAAVASELAYSNSVEFAEGLHFQTFRAVLRRHGDFGEHNLNMYLTTPLFLHIASSWCDLFKTNLFAELEGNTIKAVHTLLDKIVKGVPEYLKTRARKQANSCSAEVRSALNIFMSTAKTELQKHQRSISRGLTSHVQDELRQGYEDALLVKGRKTTEAQRQVVHDYVRDNEDTMFEDAASALMERLDEAANIIGTSLQRAMQKVAMKAEINLAVLWEEPFEDKKHSKARADLVRLLGTIVADVDALISARTLRDSAMHEEDEHPHAGVECEDDEVDDQDEEEDDGEGGEDNEDGENGEDDEDQDDEDLDESGSEDESDGEEDEEDA